MKAAIWKQFLDNMEPDIEDMKTPAQAPINITINMGDIVINEVSKDITPSCSRGTTSGKPRTVKKQGCQAARKSKQSKPPTS